jgi:hypothetical protein
MFDTSSSFPPFSPDPVAPRPAPLDTYAMLPMLQAQAAEASLEFLAVATGANALALWRWLEINDLSRDQALATIDDPASPLLRLALAQDALATACWRYRITTGHDGLALARHVIARSHGVQLADYALRPLVRATADCPELDTLLAGSAPEQLPPEPAPTVAERRTGLRALAAWLLSDPALDGLQERLEAWRLACEPEGAEPGDQAVQHALAAVGEAIGLAFRRGVEPGFVRITLNTWSEAFDAPRIDLMVRPVTDRPADPDPARTRTDHHN